MTTTARLTVPGRRLFGAMLATCFAAAIPSLKADQTWTAGSGANFLWSDGSNWSGGVPLGTDNALFGLGIPNPGLLSNPQIITLDAGSTASALRIKDTYRFTGGDLTLSSGAIRVGLGQSLSLDSTLSGTSGLVKTGGGTLRLTNNANTYTGSTLISDGTVVINATGALGGETSTVTVAGNPVRGMGGGSLLLESAYGSTLSFSRNLALQGLGPISDRGAALIGVGNVTLTGAVSVGGGSSESVRVPLRASLPAMAC